MMQQVPPEVQTGMATTATWLWETYGKGFIGGLAKKAWTEARWRAGVAGYLDSLYYRVGFVRILGRLEAEPLENIFTHVNVLDRPTAERRYDIERLMQEFSPRDFAALERTKRISGDEAVDEHERLFILGKPGAGKTTFLQHVALRAIKREIKRLPAFVTLKDMSDSVMEPLAFIIHQFQVHGFPEAERVIPSLLKNGDVLVLFDGLDEVNVEGEKRATLISQLNEFIYKFDKCPILLTCRVAAVDYSFTQFEYVEMADFDEEQIGRYVDQWFAKDKVKRANCRRALLEDPANEPVRELAQVPLLLAMLCLTYQDLNEIPAQRHEIYEEATRALLSKWDAGRNIARDPVYPQLSLRQKQSMLAHVAAATFSEGAYFLPEQRVVGLLEAYLAGVPGVQEPDGEQVLKAMEAQHGIFVERARGIHSFSHLTLQEYFTARHVVANESRGAVEALMARLGDERWDEVFALTAGLLDDATQFFLHYLRASAALVADDTVILAWLHWAAEREQALSLPHFRAGLRAFLLYQVLAPDHNSRIHVFAYMRGTDFAFERHLDLCRAVDRAIALKFITRLYLGLELLNELVTASEHHVYIRVGSTRLALREWASETFWQELMKLIEPVEKDQDAWNTYELSLEEVLVRYDTEWDPGMQIMVPQDELNWLPKLEGERSDLLARYLAANALLLRCLSVAYVPDRAAIEEQILLPP